VELTGEKILLDEKEARQAARALGLSVTGVLGIILRAYHEGTIPSVQSVIQRLQQDANFRIAPGLLAEILDKSGEI
jgi:predicted nucleic acid-binding protein